MAWSTPTSAVAGAVVSSSLTVNPIIADLALLAGASATDARASSVIWKGTVTDPVLGNGSYVSLTRQDNKWVDWTLVITMGSTTTYGSGTWQIVPPVAARTASTGIWYARAIDNAGNNGYTVNVDLLGVSLATLRTPATTAGNVDRAVTSAQPFAWGTGDILSVTGRYEAA